LKYAGGQDGDRVIAEFCGEISDPDPLMAIIFAAPERLWARNSFRPKLRDDKILCLGVRDGSMIERPDDRDARLQTLGNPPLIVFTLAPIATGNAGSDTDSRRAQVLWVDCQGAITCRRRLCKALRRQKEAAAKGPPISILRIRLRLLIDFGDGRFPARVD